MRGYHIFKETDNPEEKHTDTQPNARDRSVLYEGFAV